VSPAVNRIVAHLLRDSRLEGYRIAAIGDLHLAPWRSIAPLQKAVDVINDAEPDLIAIVGDFGYSVQRSRRISRKLYDAVLPRITGELTRLRARDGIAAVLGNHDLDAGGDVVASTLRHAGVHVLRDAPRDLVHNGACLRLVGVDDISHRHHEVPVLDASLLQGPGAVMVLSHHPDFVLRCEDVPTTCPALVISGHTHGGQVAFPWIGAPVTLSRVATRRFPAGFVPNEYVGVYVTRGLGEQIPLRILADREITLIELATR
jgi:predicted MPP superfamily phosphohydrolase